MKEKILLVEDNLDLVEILQKLLLDLGYDCTVAITGDEALEKASTDIPDLIILDLMLPGIHGLEVATKIRENPETRGIAILAITANFDFQMKIKSLAAGCDSFLVKPFTSKQLALAITSLLKTADVKKDSSPRRQAKAGI